jgi:hypothetical protein
MKLPVLFAAPPPPPPPAPKAEPEPEPEPAQEEEPAPAEEPKADSGGGGDCKPPCFLYTTGGGFPKLPPSGAVYPVVGAPIGAAGPGFAAAPTTYATSLADR